MNVSPAVYNILRGVTAITDLVSDRIYPDTLPQKQPYPAIVHYVENVDKTTYTGGATTNYKITVNLDIFFQVYANGKTLAEEVKNAIEGYRGTVGGVQVQLAFFQSQTDANYVQETETHVITQSYLFRVVE